MADEAKEPPAESTPSDIRKMVLFFAFAYVLDALLFAPGLGCLLCVLAVLIAAGAVPFFLWKRNWPELRSAAAIILLAIATLAAVFYTLYLHQRLGEANGQRIVDAVEAYHKAQGTYPDSLEALIPAYLPTIPRAAYRLAWSQFSYWDGRTEAGGMSPQLYYYALPPFGRPVYFFAKGKWTYLD